LLLATQVTVGVCHESHEETDATVVSSLSIRIRLDVASFHQQLDHRLMAPLRGARQWYLTIPILRIRLNVVSLNQQLEYRLVAPLRGP
jgi:hypothetical protein